MMTVVVGDDDLIIRVTLYGCKLVCCDDERRSSDRDGDGDTDIVMIANISPHMT